MPASTKIKRNDTAPPFSATLTDGAGTAVDLTGATALFLMRNPKTRTLKVSGSMVVVDAAAGKVRYDWAAGDTGTAGLFDVEVQVTFADTTITTFPNSGHHELEVIKDLGP